MFDKLSIYAYLNQNKSLKILAKIPIQPPKMPIELHFIKIPSRVPTFYIIVLKLFVNIRDVISWTHILDM